MGRRLAGVQCGANGWPSSRGSHRQPRLNNPSSLPLQTRPRAGAAHKVASAVGDDPLACPLTMADLTSALWVGATHAAPRVVTMESPTPCGGDSH